MMRFKQIAASTGVEFMLGCSAESEVDPHAEPPPKPKTVEMNLKDGHKIAVTELPGDVRRIPSRK